MKKYASLLLLLLPMACTLQLEEETTTATIAERVQADANRMTLPKRSHRFPFDSAVVLISDMLAIPALNKMAGSFAAGGTFPAELFRVAPDSSGIILWHGFDPVTRQVFLSLEQLKSYDVYNLPKAPTSKTLIRSASTFTSTITNPFDRASVKNSLQNETITDIRVERIDNATLLRHMNSFDSLLSTMPDNKGERYNQYLFSFFHDNRDGTFEQFLEQAGKGGYVRYYFGYDERDKPNRIRVILVAADKTGKNTSGRIDGSGDVITLQRSFPPPPDN